MSKMSWTGPSSCSKLVSSKDVVGKSINELESVLWSSRREEEELLEELKDQLQATEDAKLHLEVNIQAMKVQFDRDLQAREKEGEKRMKQLVKQVCEMKVKLENDRR